MAKPLSPAAAPGSGAGDPAALAGVCGAAGAVFGMRSAVSLALLDMTRDGAMGVTAAEVGKMNAAGQLAYVLGKLFGGAGVDKLGGRRSLLLVLIAMAASFLSMAKAKRRSLGLTAAFSVSRFATAVCWSAAAVSIKGLYADSADAASALSLGQASLRLGASAGSFAGGLFLARTRSWRLLLSASAAAGLASGIGLARGPPTAASASSPAPARPAPGDAAVVTTGGGGGGAAAAVTAAAAAAAGREPRAVTVLEALRVAAGTPKVFLLFASTALITPSFDLVALLPQFLSDEYGLDDAGVGAVCAAFPLSAPPAIVASSLALQRLSPVGKAAYLSALQASSVAAFLALARRPPREALVPALLAVAAGIAPSLSCVAPAWIVKWAGPHAGLFCGLHDIAGNLLAMLIYAKAPRIVKRSGWWPVLRLYALQVGLGACCMAGFQLLEAASPTRGTPFLMAPAGGGGGAEDEAAATAATAAKD